MPDKKRAGFWGAIAVIVILFLQSIEHWAVVDAVIAGLRGMGAGGKFIADILMSRLLPLVIAIAAIYLSFEGRMERGANPSLPPPNQHIATQTASPHVEQKVIIGGEVLGQKKEIAPKPETPEAAPNIIFMDARPIRIRHGVKGDTFWESDGETDPLAVIACFRNEPSMSKKVAPAFDVKGGIIYRGADDREVGDGISEACWIGEPMSIDFTVQMSRCVILAIVTGDGSICNFYKRETHSNWGLGLAIDPVEIGKDVKTIEVRLLQGNDLLIRPLIFDFAVIDKRPEVKLRPEADTSKGFINPFAGPKWDNFAVKLGVLNAEEKYILHKFVLQGCRMLDRQAQCLLLDKFHDDVNSLLDIQTKTGFIAPWFNGYEANQGIVPLLEQWAATYKPD